MNPQQPRSHLMREQPDRFAAIVRAVFGRFVAATKVETLRRELIRAGIVALDEGQAP
jgi:hypothetical protein